MQRAVAERVQNKDVGRCFYFMDICFVDTDLDKNISTNEIHIQHLVHEFHDEGR